MLSFKPSFSLSFTFIKRLFNRVNSGQTAWVHCLISPLSSCMACGKKRNVKFVIYNMVLVSGSVQFSSVAQSYLNLCDPMNRRLPGLPVHHQLPEFIQTHVHRVGDAIQPTHPLSSPFPPASNPSQHHSLFQ